MSSPTNPYQSPSLSDATQAPGALAGAPVAPPLWNPKAAALWSLLFSWAFGSFLLARNWKALGDNARAKRCMIWFYAFFPFLLAAILSPDSSGVASLFRIGGIGIFVAWIYAEQSPQLEYVRKNIGEQYPRKSWLKPIGIASGAAVGLFGAIFAAALFANWGGGLGTELTFNGGQIFYQAPVTEAEANRLGKYLVDNQFFDGTPKSVQIKKSADTYDFRMVVTAGYNPDQDQINMFKQFGSQLSKEVFIGAAVTISLCDGQLRTLRTIAADAQATQQQAQ